MDREGGAGRLGSFLIGGLVGSAAGLAAAGRVRVRATRGRRASPPGLAAFEEAPCYRELADREAAGEEREEGSPSV